MHAHHKTPSQPSVSAKSAQHRPPVTPLSAAAGIMQLQGTIGNRAVGRLLSSQAPVIQRKVIGRLGDYSVHDTKYENDNEDALVNHMGGEWNGNNDGAVKGGHLLTKMVSTWGAAQYGKEHDLRQVDRSGVYFTGGRDLPTHLTNQQFEFFLGRKVQNNKTMSRLKESTFWPRGWGEGEFRAVLNNSYKTNIANIYASKANTSYWYTWEMLGDNTAFPTGRYARLE
jgi:hypothetical protein